MGKKNKITPFLWFDKEASEAASFYISVFGMSSKDKGSTLLDNTPSGKTETVGIELFGQEFGLISAGPFFKFSPSVSFLVNCKTKDEVDAFWESLSAGGKARMVVGEYPFSERYGWIEDKFGLSWQLMSTGGKKAKQRIIPTLMFSGAQCGRCEEAINFYASVFRKAKVGQILRYVKGEMPDKEGTIKHAAFTLEGQEFAAMDSARVKDTFNEAISFVVHCSSQKEIDYFWGRLSADPKAEQCGWLKDKFGLSWQIVPDILEKMLNDPDNTKVAKVTEAFLKMKKFDIKALKKAYKG